MYMIDVSGSMIGLPPDSGARDIFPKVAETLKEHIKTLKSGSRVFIFTFADGPHDVDGAEGIHYRPMWEKEIRDATERLDKEEIERYVDQLNQDVRENIGHGWETAIYDSVKIALERFDKLREDYEKTHPSEKYKDLHIQKIILFTDGKDTRSKEWNFERFLNEFNFRRAEDKMGDRIFLKIITLGEHVFSEEERKKIEEQPWIEIRDQPEPEKEIIIASPIFLINPSKISFDGLTRNATEHQQFIVKAENLLRPKSLNIILEGINKEIIDLSLSPSIIHLTPEEPSATFTLEVKAIKNLPWWKSSKVEILIQDPGKTVAKAAITFKGAVPWTLFSSILAIIVIGGVGIILIKKWRYHVPNTIKLNFERFERIRIGRGSKDPDGVKNQISLWDESVPLCAAELYKKDKKYYIESVEGRVQVNDEQADTATELDNGARIKIGEFEFEFIKEKENVSLSIMNRPERR